MRKAILAALTLAGCGAGMPENEARLSSAISGGRMVISGETGAGFSEEDIRKLVEPICAAEGKTLASFSLAGEPEEPRTVVATCTP